MVFCSKRYTRTFRSFASSSFCNCIRYFPQVGSDLGFFPFATIIYPPVTSADLHAGILFSLKFFILIITGGNITLLFSVLGYSLFCLFFSCCFFCWCRHSFFMDQRQSLCL